MWEILQLQDQFSKLMYLTEGLDPQVLEDSFFFFFFFFKFMHCV